MQSFPRGQPQGIRNGVIYIRTPKPESSPVTTPEQWDKLIQRCVLARRDELVGMFSTIVSGAAAPAQGKQAVDANRERLTAWHRAAQKVALSEAARLGVKFRFPLAENFAQFSYMILHKNGVLIPAKDALQTAGKLNTAVRDTVRYGWSMFYPFTRREISPRFVTDPAVDGGDTDFLQTSLFEDGQTGHGDFWRIALDGRASLFRNFQEDRFNPPRGISEGQKWVDPWLHIRDVTEAVRHARAMAEEYPGGEGICFLFEWRGLKDRLVAALNPERYWPNGLVSNTDQRIVYNYFPIAEVIGNLPGVVSRLYAPIYRLFDPSFEVSSEWVGKLMKGFIAF